MTFQATLVPDTSHPAPIAGWVIFCGLQTWFQLPTGHLRSEKTVESPAEFQFASAK
jgi:hypothetical protein